MGHNMSSSYARYNRFGPTVLRFQYRMRCCEVAIAWLLLPFAQQCISEELIHNGSFEANRFTGFTNTEGWDDGPGIDSDIGFVVRGYPSGDCGNEWCSGDYQYDPSKEAGYPHQRPVKWLKTQPRTRFSQGALYEIGSAISLFQIKNYTEEFLAALHGKTSAPPVDKDESVSVVAEEIEESTC